MTLRKVLKLGLIHSVFWITVQLSLSNIMLRYPSFLFVRYESVFKIRSWEKRGALWNKLFRINKWKHYIPEAAQFNYRIYIKGDWLHLNWKIYIL